MSLVGTRPILQDELLKYGERCIKLNYLQICVFRRDIGTKIVFLHRLFGR